MLSLSQTIITNVEESYIETYLRQNGLFRTKENEGQELKYWVDDLLSEKQINVLKFEDFLFDELFWGKRKTIRVYKLDSVRKIKYPNDWEKPLQEIYGIGSLDFCNILGSVPNTSEKRKVAAVRAIENVYGELKKMRILFVEYIEISGKNGNKGSSSYIPVEIDFEKKIMIIKGWKRQQIASDDYKIDELIDHIKRLLEIEFELKVKDFSLEHKKVLYIMSRKLINEAYSRIPTYNQIPNLDGLIGDFINNVLVELPLENVTTDKQGNCKLKDGVMEFRAELKNVMEGLVVSDYFFEKDFGEIWRMGLEAIVARIKFNDKERVLTSLSGEDTSIPIFCTKTFMTLKNRMEDSEKVETLWITMDREKGNLNLKFDATNREYLEILIRYGIRFKEKDMDSALGIYEKYNRRLNEKIAEKSRLVANQ